jgi:hypothetical protein
MSSLRPRTALACSWSAFQWARARVGDRDRLGKHPVGAKPAARAERQWHGKIVDLDVGERPARGVRHASNGGQQLDRQPASETLLGAAAGRVDAAVGRVVVSRRGSLDQYQVDLRNVSGRPVPQRLERLAQRI